MAVWKEDHLYIVRQDQDDVLEYNPAADSETAFNGVFGGFVCNGLTWQDPYFYAVADSGKILQAKDDLSGIRTNLDISGLTNNDQKWVGITWLPFDELAVLNIEDIGNNEYRIYVLDGFSTTVKRDFQPEGQSRIGARPSLGWHKTETEMLMTIDNGGGDQAIRLLKKSDGSTVKELDVSSKSSDGGPRGVDYRGEDGHLYENRGGNNDVHEWDDFGGSGFIGELLGAPWTPAGMVWAYTNKYPKATIRLRWTERCGRNALYRLQRRNITQDTAFSDVTTLGPGRNKYDDQVPTLNEEYGWRIRSENDQGESPWSNIARLTPT